MTSQNEVAGSRAAEASAAEYAERYALSAVGQQEAAGKLPKKGKNQKKKNLPAAKVDGKVQISFQILISFWLLVIASGPSGCDLCRALDLLQQPGFLRIYRCNDKIVACYQLCACTACLLHILGLALCFRLRLLCIYKKAN